MAEIITFLIVAAAIVAVIGYFAFRDMTEQQQREDAEYEAFEQHRAERQAVFDRHAQEVAHRSLMEACENVHIGNWRGSYGQKD